MRQAVDGYAFLGLPLIGLVLFTVVPVVGAFLLSTLRWDLLTEPRFTGLCNFVRLANDARFWNAPKNTAYYAFGSVPLGIASALGVALLLNHKLPAISLFRSASYVPHVTSWVAVALVWTWLYNRDYGLVNVALRAPSVQGPAWLNEPLWAMPALIFVGAWKSMGFFAVILLAGLQNIPSTYYEAAAVDGAGAGARFRHITLPLLSPALFFVLVTATIQAFNVFDLAFVMTRGGPNDATQTLMLYFFDNAFNFFQIGYASAVAVALFRLVFGVTVPQNWLQRRWVHYE